MELKYSNNRTKEKSIWNIVEFLLLVVIVTSNLEFVPSALSMFFLYTLILVGGCAILYKGKLKINFLNNCFYCYCLFSLFSLILSPYFQGGLILSVGQYILITIVLINIPIDRIEKVLNRYVKVLSGLVYTGIAYSFVLKTFGHYMQYEGRRINYFITPFIRQRTDGASWEIGHCAFWDNPNVFGFCIVIIFIYKLSEEGKAVNKKILSLLYLGFGSLLANSRGVYICLILAIVVYFYLHMKSESKLLSTLFIVAIGIGILTTGAITTVVESVDLTGRGEMWSGMIDTIQKYPIFGVGFSVTSKFILSEVVGRVVGSHNSYLNVLAENGIVGFVILILIIVCVLFCIYLIKGKKRVSINDIDDTWFMFCSVLFVTFLAYGMIENAFMIIGSRNFLWMMLCMYIYNFVKKQN